MESSNAKTTDEAFLLLLSSLGIEGEKKAVFLGLSADQKRSMIEAQKKTAKADGLEIVKKIVSAKRLFSASYTISEIDRCVETLNEARFSFTTLTEEGIEKTLESGLLEEVWDIVTRLAPAQWSRRVETYLSVHDSKQNKPVFRILEPAVRLFKCFFTSPAVIKYVKGNKNLFKKIFEVFPSQYLAISEIALEIADHSVEVYNNEILEHFLGSFGREGHAVCVPACDLRIKHAIDEMYYNISLENVSSEFLGYFLSLLKQMHSESLLTGILLDSMLRLCDISKVLSRITQKDAKMKDAVDALVQAQERCREMATQIDVRKVEENKIPLETKEDLQCVLNALSVLYRVNSSRMYDVLQYIKGSVLEEASFKRKDQLQIEKEREIRVTQRQEVAVQSACVCKNIRFEKSPKEETAFQKETDKKEEHEISENKQNKPEINFKEGFLSIPEKDASLPSQSSQKPNNAISKDPPNGAISKDPPHLPPPPPKKIAPTPPPVLATAVSPPLPPTLPPKSAPSPPKLSPLPLPPNLPPRSPPLPPHLPPTPPPPRSLPGGMKNPLSGSIPNLSRPPPPLPGRSAGNAPEIKIEEKKGPRAEYMEKAAVLHPPNSQLLSLDFHIRKPQTRSVWEALDQEDLAPFKKEEFSSLTRESSSNTASGAAQAFEAEAPAMCKNRCKAIDIVLARVKMPLQELVHGVEELNQKYFTETLLSGLLANYPTQEELKAIGEKETVQLIPELFYKHSLEVPRFKEKLTVLYLFATSENITQGLLPNIERLLNGCRALLTDSSIQKVFRISLAVANIINAGTRYEGAWGIKIEGLAKLAENKKVSRIIQDKVHSMGIEVKEALHALKEMLLVSPEAVEAECFEYKKKSEQMEDALLTEKQKEAVSELNKTLTDLETSYQEWKKTLGEVKEFFNEPSISGEQLYTLSRFLIHVCVTR